MNGDDDGTHIHDLKPCMVSVLIYISKLEEQVHDNMRNQPSTVQAVQIEADSNVTRRACDAQ